MLQAAVDDRFGYFILDTGAPALILNQRYFRGTAFSGSYQQSAFGLNGEVKEVLTKDADLQMGDRKWKNVHALLYDLEYLEEMKSIAILGLLGGLLFKDYELEIDFERQQLVIYELDRQGEKMVYFSRYAPPDVIVPFKQKGHMPFIEAYVEGLPLRLGIDSGAGIALIINEKQTELSQFAKPGDLIRIRGLSQNSVQTRSYQLRGLSVANLSYQSLKVAFADLDYINRYLAGIDLHGILGLDLLSKHRTAFNFKKKEIYIWMPLPENDQLVLLDAEKDD